MAATMTRDCLIAARASALFVSDLSSGCRPSESAVAAAIKSAVAAHGVRGCAGEVAAAYGEHPETASPRMRWARQLVEAIYTPAAIPGVGSTRRPEAQSSRRLAEPAMTCPAGL